MNDEYLDYMDGYHDAEMGVLPQTMDGDYYVGYMMYQDELEDEKQELEDRKDALKNDIMDDIDSGDFDSARDSLDELDDIDEEIDSIDGELY